MGKNDFDIDFDYEKEFGFDPKAFLGSEESDENIDLSQFSDEELGLSPRADEESGEDSAASADGADLSGDFDLDMDLDDFLNLGDEAEPDAEENYEALDGSDLADEEDPGFPDEKEWDDAPEFPDDAESEEIDMSRNTDYSEEDFTDQADLEDGSEEKPKSPRPRRKPKERKPAKPAGPNIFTKFYDLYFAPLMDKSLQEEPQDPNNPRRRRRKSKAQIFKEVYLPPIIACLCLILVLSFVIGAISNSISQYKIDKNNEQSRQDSSISAAALAEQEHDRILSEAALLAAGYNYQEAIDLLDSFPDMSNYSDMVQVRAEYATIQDNLVTHNDPNAIKNLSFHLLLEDPVRAYADTGEGGLAAKYNKNFVSTSEFKKILNDLYNNGYVLVDFDSFAVLNSDQILTESIYLPEGKKPFMLTETLVNYFNYMVDGNGDGVPDAGGKGFASKLVLDGNGDIKAEYVDASGNTLVGDYDLVPILESFIKEHPDFSYRGARAILAVCGYEGIFGYRINTSNVSTKGQTYYDEQVAGAKQIVQALRDKGYTLACYSYNNEDYSQKNANQIQADLQSWTSQIVPVIGSVDTFVFAQESNITDYGTGNAFNIMYSSGFRYFVSNGNEAYTEVRSNYVRQNRLMVTGKTMAYNSSWFTGMFDCAAILDVNLRGTVPNA